MDVHKMRNQIPDVESILNVVINSFRWKIVATVVKHPNDLSEVR